MQNQKRFNPDPGAELKKANGAIHVDSRALSITHRKAFNILLYEAWDELTKNKTHSINASRLAHWLGFHDISRLAKELGGLPLIKVEWNIVRDDGWPIDQGVCGLLSGIQLKGNQFYYSFFEPLRGHLKDPNLWTKVKIDIANLFSSRYALSLYENCLRYAKVGTTGWKEVDEWRSLIGIPETATYKTFGVVNKKILKPAIDQINRLSDLSIAPGFKRRGRGGAFNKMRFLITTKSGYRLPERLAKLPLKKQDIAVEAAKIEPLEGTKNPARYYLEERRRMAQEQANRPKPLWVKFSSKPSNDVRHVLLSNGFEYMVKDRIWLNKKTTNEIVNRIVPQVTKEEGAYGYGTSPQI